MSAAQNLIYASVQVVHNFGAVAVVGGSLSALWLHEPAARKRLAMMSLAGWLIQAASGATFGMVTFHYHRQLPDISGVAANALGIKMMCAILAILLLASYLQRAEHWQAKSRDRTWIAASLLGMSALSAAAFLRWFS
jgi:hypothetical protein